MSVSGDGDGDASAPSGDGDGEAVLTTNVTAIGPEPSLIVSNWPNPNQYAPFQPSPYVSVMIRVQATPSVVTAVPEKGLPPERVAPSVHERLHPTSLWYEPPETVIVNVLGTVGEGDGSGDGDGDGSGDGDGDGSGEEQPEPRSHVLEPVWTVYTDVPSEGIKPQCHR